MPTGDGSAKNSVSPPVLVRHSSEANDVWRAMATMP
jgi:hypothetical protein